MVLQSELTPEEAYKTTNNTTKDILSQLTTFILLLLYSVQRLGWDEIKLFAQINRAFGAIASCREENKTPQFFPVGNSHIFYSNIAINHKYGLFRPTNTG